MVVPSARQWEVSSRHMHLSVRWRRHTAASVAFPIVPPAFGESTTMTDKDYATRVFGGDAIDQVRPIAPYTSVLHQFFSHSNTIPASRRTASRPASRMIGSRTM